MELLILNWLKKTSKTTKKKHLYLQMVPPFYSQADCVHMEENEDNCYQPSLLQEQRMRSQRTNASLMEQGEH